MKTKDAKRKQIAATRELHLIDIENEIGKAEPSATEVAQFRHFYLAFNNVPQDAHIATLTCQCFLPQTQPSSLQ